MYTSLIGGYRTVLFSMDNSERSKLIEVIELIDFFYLQKNVPVNANLRWLIMLVSSCFRHFC